TDMSETAEAAAVAIAVNPLAADAPFESDFTIAGSVPNAPGLTELRLLRNGNLDAARSITVGSDGAWSATVPVRNLGDAEEYLQVYEPRSGALSDKIPFSTRITGAEISGSASDEVDDGQGPTGGYIRPQQSESGDQREIMGARWRAAGANLELTLTMKVITDVWQPPNGFDNLAISTFIDIPGRQGASDLPLLNAAMPAGNDWDVAHVGSGWISYTYSSDRSSAKRQGSKFGVAPRVTASKDQREITLFFQGERLGINSWDDATLYVTTWDVNGEGTYLNTDPEPSNWHFGGAPADAPKVMDDLLVTISTDD
ncbi:MAG: glucodextranase DOMON-like domain-containing protein, partial [Xanthomonadales bacterium]|nr:glucodextranase DOMON-like domain-containing protein [Xanthomonadales bacterium]